MKKIFACLITGCVVVSSFALSARADDGYDAAKGSEYLLFQEEQIVIGVNKKEEKLAKVPMSVYVVSKEEMNRWGVHALKDIMDKVPGINSFRDIQSGLNSSNGRYIRGCDGWAIGYGIELIPVYDWGWTLFPVNFFKSVEIARGPASITWGPGATLGMMNVNLRDDIDGVEAIYELGTSQRQNMDLLFGKKFVDGEKGDGIFVGLHQSEKESELIAHSAGRDGWVRTPGCRRRQAVAGKVKYKGLKFIYMREDGASNDWQGPDSYEQSLGFSERINNLILTVYGIEYKLPVDWINLTLYHTYYNKEFHRSNFVTQSIHYTKTYGFRSTNAFLDGRFTLDAGGNVARKDTFNDPSYRMATTGVVTVTPKSSQDYWDGYLQGTYNLTDRWTAVLGGLMEFLDGGFPKQHMFSGPRFALMYAIDDTSGFKYIYNNASRRAVGNEAAYANINDVETLEAHDLVWYMHKEKFSFDATVYTQDFDNPFNSAIAANSYTARGLELNAKYYPIKKLLLYWNGTYGFNDSSSSLSNLYMPQFNTYAGAEYSFPWVKVNLAAAYAAGISYYNENLEKVDTDLTEFDLILRTTDRLSKNFFGSLMFQNLFNEKKGMPVRNYTATNFLANPATHALSDQQLAPTEGMLISGKITFKY